MRGVRKARTASSLWRSLSERKGEGREVGETVSFQEGPTRPRGVYKPRSAVIEAQLPPDMVTNLRASTARNDTEDNIKTSKLLL